MQVVGAHAVARRRARVQGQLFRVAATVHLGEGRLGSALVDAHDTIPPRRTLARFLADEETAKPGARIDAPPFDAGGSSWQVQLYLLGAGESYADRVGLYIKRLPSAASTEVDASFSMSVQMLPDPAALEVAPAERAADCLRGNIFRCGMTFCDAREAGESVASRVASGEENGSGGGYEATVALTR